MKPLLRALALLAFAFVSLAAVEARAQSPTATAPEIIAAVTAADDERVAAALAGDRARLDAILSDELRYAHSNGKIDTKASLIESLVLRTTVYEGFDYRQRSFISAAPGVVLMPGRVIVHVRSGSDGPTRALDLNFLAVWREENGRWRFLAWQSCPNPAEKTVSGAKDQPATR